MAVLHRKEEKIQIVLGRLPKKYTHEQFVEMFIKLYSKDWGKIKSAYIKQSQDKEPGTVINMPKPDLYLKQVLTSYLEHNNVIETVEKNTLKNIELPKEKKSEVLPKNTIKVEESKVEIKKEKTSAKKNKEEIGEVKKVVAKKKK